MKLRFTFLLFFFFVLIALSLVALVFWRSSWRQSGPVEAAGFGISPPYFRNLDLGPGESYSADIKIMRTQADSTRIIDVVTHTPGFSDWLEFSPGVKFPFWEGDIIQILKVTVQVPENAQPGTYQGDITLRLSPGYDSGVSVAIGARVDVEIKVKGGADGVVLDLKTEISTSSAVEYKVQAGGPYERLKGYFLIRPESRGELYYFSPDYNIYHLPDAGRAALLFEKLSIGISEQDLSLLPMPGQPGKNTLAWSPGHIFLQAEDRGQLWYVYPKDKRRYFLGQALDSYLLAQILSLGIGESAFSQLVGID